jgi:signal transduction histidine kinase
MAESEGRSQGAVGTLTSVGRAAALGALAIAITEVVGAMAGIERITAPVAGGPPMSATAAVAFTLAAMALLVDESDATTARRAARDALAVAAAAIAVTALLDRVLDLWPGIGMPSVPASCALILMAAALVVLNRSTPDGKRPAEALGAVVGFIGLVTLLGHVLGAPQLVRAPDHGTALAGSICMCLLATALLLARPGRGLVSLLQSPTAGGTTARRLGFTTIVVLPLLAIVVGAARSSFGLEERSAFALLVAGATTLVLAVIALTSVDLDRSERKAQRARVAEHELRTLLEALTLASDAISQAVARMEGHDLVPVMREIAEQARLLVGTKHAAVGIPSEDDPAAFTQLVTAEEPTDQATEATPLLFAGSHVGTLLLGPKRSGEPLGAQDRQKIDLFASRAASALRAARVHEVEVRGREWLQTVMDQMPEPVLITDDAGRVVHWNRAANDARASDDPLERGDHSHVLDLRLPSGAPLSPTETPCAMALERGEAVTGIELVLKTRTGALVPVAASAAPLRDLDGSIRGAVGLYDDISTLKQLERMREEWTAVIAHDLRQPINGIVLHAQVLRRGLGPAATDKQLESIEHIRIAALRQNRMIEDLLDATRIEASRLKLERRSVALPQLIHQILARRPELGDREVRVEAQQGLPEVFADAARVEQVMSNLLTNAAKYGERGTAIDVHIEQDEDQVRVSVVNEGAEIDEAHLSRLFSRFYRTPSAEAGPQAGLGLGLYISKGLVEAHGGRIWAESRSRRTFFRFTLPPTSRSRTKTGTSTAIRRPTTGSASS